MTPIQVVRFNMIRCLCFVVAASMLSFGLLSTAYAQGGVKRSNKKIVKIVMEGTKGKNTKAKNPKRLPASLVESPEHGNIVHVNEYVAEVESLDTTKMPKKKRAIQKNKKQLAKDVEVSRDMIVSN